MEDTRVVIVGGGFAGATLAERLSRRAAPNVEIVVISSENHMVFTPMLAEVAGRSLSPLDVVIPGRQIARGATWVTAAVNGVDLNKLDYNAAGRYLSIRIKFADYRELSIAGFDLDLKLTAKRG